MSRILAVAAAIVLVSASSAFAATLEVGPGKKFAAIEQAYDRAAKGDTILVSPLPKGQAYTKEALLIRKAGLTFKSAGKDGEKVVIDGGGFDYSGAGKVPRAIFQFDPGADGCALEGFELKGAHNDSHNGAGVRINQANNVTIRNCDIHDNDMGIMSNGQLADRSAANQLIESCRIWHNGSEKEPGQNHNLYLGGTSVTLRGCEVFASLTGHNVKSRAHFNFIEACYIHDSANREFDLVDAKGTTDQPGSDSVLIGNLIVKAAKMNGNKTVIHFGQDGGHGHDGTIYLVHNTIITPYISPVVDLSAAGASAKFTNNIVCDPSGAGNGLTLVHFEKGSDPAKTTGEHNWFSAGFAASLPEKMKQGNAIGDKKAIPPFVDMAKDDFHLKPDAAGATVFIGAGLPLDKIDLPPLPSPAAATAPAKPPMLNILQYVAPLKYEARSDAQKPDLGAFQAGLAKQPAAVPAAR